MAESITDFLVRLTVDGGSADRELKSVAGRFTELNSAAELAKKGFALASSAYDAFAKTIDRGQAFSELSNAFTNLYGSTQTFASDGLGKLREALGGTVDDLGILKSANIAAQAGLSPDAYLEVAKAAESLGDVVGKDATTALEDLSRGLALGQERLLKQYGIVVDSTKAQAEFAKSLGTTADKLNEAGKLAAFQAEATRQLSEKAKNAGVNAETAGDQIEKMGVALSNLKTSAAAAINENTALVQSLKGVTSAAIEASNVLGKYFSTFGSESSIDTVRNKIKLLETDLKNANEIAGQGIPLISDNAFENALKYNAELQRLQGVLFRLEETQKQVGETSGQTFGIGSITNAKEYGQQLKDLRAQYIDTGKGAKEAAEAAAKLTLETAQLGDQLKDEQLSDSLQQAVDSLNATDFARLNQAMVEAEVTAHIRGITDPAYIAEVQKSAAYHGQQRAEAFIEAERQAQDILEEEWKQRFDTSVDFFSDLLGDVINDSGRSLEEVFTDALKEVAISFGANILASLTGGFSTSTEGIGAALAQAALGYFGVGGGGGSAGSLFGTAGSLASTGYSLFGGSGAAAGGYGYTSATTGAAVNYGGGSAAFAGSTLATIAGVAAGAAVAYLQYDTARELTRAESVDGLSNTNRATLAYSTFGFSEVARAFGVDDDILGGIFGRGNVDRYSRMAGRTTLQDNYNFGENLTFQGYNGREISLLDSDYTRQNRTQFSDQATALANPFAHVFTGGDDKLGSDFANIFADAIDDGKNFNEVLADAQGLMEGFGISGEDVKKELTNLFLDGKISLDEYNADLANMNLLMQDSLPGIGDVAGAFEILSSETATNRTVLKGLEFAFKELEESGVQSAEQIKERFGPEAAEVFTELASIGVDSFEDIANATPDMINQIFNVLGPFLAEFRDGFGDAANGAADGVEAGGNKMLAKLREVEEQAYRTQRAINGGGGGDSSGGDGFGANFAGNDGSIQPIGRKLRYRSNASGVDDNPRLTTRS